MALPVKCFTFLCSDDDCGRYLGHVRDFSELFSSSVGVKAERVGARGVRAIASRFLSYLHTASLVLIFGSSRRKASVSVWKLPS